MLFLKDLTDILEKLEIKLIQIEPWEKKEGLLTLIPYTMELKCNYEEIGKLVTELEASNRLITVDEIIIKNGIEKIKKNNNNQDAINDVKTILAINTVTLNKPKQNNMNLRQKFLWNLTLSFSVIILLIYFILSI